ncbi:protein adenylyltransferase SelO [Tepidimonas aquatica]|uniref:Protein nucleotidyltransferase YdiU n=1 Tax=Tepidimonas aquatica TaxID=247482 RepID=A0A554WE86_9BURK|nr:YdiU family protein [Tepidimonas aquatica]TSE21867.1 hypothetical protein Taqua_02243 [Tepidimonas aquatica]
MDARVTPAAMAAPPHDPAPWQPALQALWADTLPELTVPCRAQRWPAPRLVWLHDAVVAALGWPVEALHGPDGVALLAGAALPPAARPVALVYAGHQFGRWAGRLGDGRALLLGEVACPNGALVDVGLKGSGATPLARGGDGRAALGPMLREALVSEAMHALGIPTTRTLAVLTTGDTVWRDGPQPGAWLVRVATSHLRVGTFQWVAALDDPGLLRRLWRFAAQRHDPALLEGLNPDACDPDRVQAWLGAVVLRQARLVALWMGVGFIHGVMNTDNMTISGETIDYGPCAFMEGYDPATVHSSIDLGGRYAWGNQPRIAQWNLARLSETLLPLLHPDHDTAVALATDAVRAFGSAYQRAWRAVMRAKLGLAAPHPGGAASPVAWPPTVPAQDDAWTEDDDALITDWLNALAAERVDWTLAHRRLANAVADVAQAGLGALPEHAPAPLHALWSEAAPLQRWWGRWRARCVRDGVGAPVRAAAMRRANPWYIPRNQRMEEVLHAALAGDLAPARAFAAVLQRPFDEQPGAERWAAPAPPEWAQRYVTFCGT